MYPYCKQLEYGMDSYRPISSLAVIIYFDLGFKKKKMLSTSCLQIVELSGAATQLVSDTL